MNKFLLRFSVLGFALVTVLTLSAHAHAQETTTVDVQSIDEKYFYFSDLLRSIQLNPLLFSGEPTALLSAGVGLAEGIQDGCTQFNFWGVKFGGGDFNFKFDTNTLKRIAGSAKEFGQNGVTYNGIRKQLIPSVESCKPMPFETIAHMGGDIDVSVAHFGTGPYTRKKRNATYHTSRDIVIENTSNTSIELPVSITGSTIAAVDFGWTPKSYARARLQVHGTIAGHHFDETAEVIATGGLLPEQQDINVVRRINVAPGAGNTTIHIDISAEAETEIQAKSAGLAGVLTDAATAGIQFPNSIDIGNFTGTNGSSLPVGVRIYDPEDGSLYADTRVFPGLPNLQTTATLSRDPMTNEIIATATVKNLGPGEAQDVRIAGVTLNNVTATTSLPQSIGRLIPERPASTAVLSFRFPATVGARGTRTTLRIAGTRSDNGSFGGTFRVTLP